VEPKTHGWVLSDSSEWGGPRFIAYGRTGGKKDAVKEGSVLDDPDCPRGPLDRLKAARKMQYQDRPGLTGLRAQEREGGARWFRALAARGRGGRSIAEGKGRSQGGEALEDLQRCRRKKKGYLKHNNQLMRGKGLSPRTKGA